MNFNAVGKGILIAFAGYGVIIEHQVEKDEGLTIYISVPEHGFEKDVWGNEMAGKNLALRYKEVLKSLGMKDFVIKSKIRKGENWTQELRIKAENNMKTMLKMC